MGKKKKQQKQTTTTQRKPANNNKPQDLAPRRNARPRRGKPLPVRAFRAVDNPITVRAQGDRVTIMVQVPVEPMSVECFPLALMSVGLSLGFPNTPAIPLYSAYLARMTDFISLLKGSTPVVPARLTFENYIDATYLPKDVPFKTGTISCAWTNTDAVTIPTSITIRGYIYYLYTINGLTAGPWNLQGPPAVPTVPEAVPVLAVLYNYISSKTIPHLEYTTELQLMPEYSKDISGFGANSLYYGAGNSLAGGPVKSAEWETPVKAPLLSCFSIFSPLGDRVARHLKLTGGDSTFVNGCALIPGFQQEIFKTKINPVFGFLDLDEVVYWLLSWYVALLKQAQKDPIFDGQGNLFDYFLQLPVNAQQFRIAVRQAILGYFMQTQASAQFLTYSVDANGFEPFRVSSNTYSQNRYQMLMPSLLVENLRMLLPRFLAPAGKLQRSHNQQMYVPVWGIYKGLDRSPPSVVGDFNNGSNALSTLPIFANSIDPTDPSMIDGTNNNSQVVDMNSPLVNEIILDWNSRIDELQKYSTTSGFLGGTATGSLLTLTRYCHYSSGDTAGHPLSSMTRLQRKHLNPSYIKTRKIARTLSKKTQEVSEEQYYLPDDASLFMQFTDAYSSLGTITETVKLILSYFIVPTIAIENDGTLPSSRQIRTANLQSHMLDFIKLEGAFSVASRGSKLMELGSRCAPGSGVAGKADELMATLQAMSDNDKGGFFGSLAGALFPEVAPITNLLPF
jgi:hypothetical protein